MSRLAVSLRIARRDIIRAPGRTLLTVAMVALPVMAVTAADVLLRSVDGPAGAAAADQLGPRAEAVVRELAGRPAQVQQDATGTAYGSSGPAGSTVPLADSELLEVLPPGSRLAEVARGIATVQLPDGPGRVRAELADPADPLLAGRYSVTRGRLPSEPGEVAVAPKVVAAGLDVGGTTTDGAGRTLRVTGVLPSGDVLAASLLALPGTTTLEPDDFADPRQWFVDSPQPVTWQDVQELNELGAVATSRAVLRDPPPDTGFDTGGGTGRFAATVVGLVTAMAVLEIVLLAGPAFALGARRQRRALAQLVAAGGRPSDCRRVVLAEAGLLGVLAAVTGIGLGLGVAVLARSTVPALEADASFVVPTVDLVVIFTIAVLSALLAALGPARGVARAHPVAVLTERPDPPRASRVPVLGALALLGIGLVASSRAARGGDEVSVALSAAPTVLGAVLLAPLAVVLAAKVAGALPFALRYAVRDAARQRARTAPAVGAIAAVVAGAVALGIGASSDEAQARATNHSGGAGTGVATVSAPPLDPAVWDRIAGAVRTAAPGTQVTALRGVRQDETVELCLPDTAMDCERLLLGGYGGALGTNLAVGRSALTALAGVAPEVDGAAAGAVLQAGGVVAFSDGDRPARELVIRIADRSVRVPAVVVPVPQNAAPVRAVLSASLARSLQLDVGTTALTIAGDVDGATRRAIADAVDLRAPEASLVVPTAGKGSDSGRTTQVALLLLAAVAGFLVLGGVLTSTLLALSDARPQFATLHAIGASSRSRRLVAAGYAATSGLVGAVLGVAAGAVPGVAVAYPLTRDGGAGPGSVLPQHLDIPWLLIGVLLVGVPALAAAAAAISARGPLPQRSRAGIT